MRCSLVLPAYNEEKTIKSTLKSIFKQTRRPDELIIINDGSIDETSSEIQKILKKHSREVLLVLEEERLLSYSKSKKMRVLFVQREENHGKTHSLTEGFERATGDVVITTDADTILHKKFVEKIIEPFDDPEVCGATGNIRSQKGTSLMAARQIEYFVSVGVHKDGQGILNAINVISGCAAAYRRSAVEEVGIETDIITEDMDITWKLAKEGYKISFVNDAIVYTQDPPNIKSLWKQLNRWYTGTAQCMKKHKDIFIKGGKLGKLTIPIVIFDSFFTSVLVVALLFLSVFNALNGNFSTAYWLLVFLCVDLIIATLVAMYGYFKVKRRDLLKGIPMYLVLAMVNRMAWTYSITKEFLLPTKRYQWLKAERV